MAAARRASIPERADITGVLLGGGEVWKEKRNGGNGSWGGVD
jgi:hypothetical protein